MSEQPTVFVVDDDPAVLDSISQLLSSQGFATRCFSNARAYLECVSEDLVGCLVLDLRMPGVTGIQLLQQLLGNDASRPTVIVSGYADVPAVVKAMKLGATDVLQKPCAPDHLIEVVREALATDVRERSRKFLCRGHLQRIETLSCMDQQILSGIVRGLTNLQIAEALDISLRSVQLRRKQILVALEVTSKADLFEVVRSAGWSPVEPS
jgi:FixJ family two-component response regulator